MTQNYKLGGYSGSKKYHLTIDSLLLCHKSQKSSKFMTSVNITDSLTNLKESEFAYALCANCLAIAESQEDN